MSATTLPYNRKVVPADAATLTIRSLGEMETFDGVAFRAEVVRKGETIGLIENEGRGGGTWFTPVAVGVRADWEALVQQHREILQADDPDTGHLAEEDLADALYDNAALFKELNRRRNVVVLPDPSDMERILVSSVPGKDLDKARPAIRKQFPDALVWIKKKGWERP